MPIPAPKAQTQLLAAPYSTYRIGGPMDEAYLPESKEQLLALLEQLTPRLQAGEGLSILGWGSNTVVASQGIRGITLILRKLNTFTWLEQTETQARAQIEAGVHLAKVANTTVEAGYSGGEFFIGIPGTMGGAVVMNAGAMGQETAGCIESVALWNFKTQQLETWTPEELGFAYRRSGINPQQHLVLSATCTFKAQAVEAARERMQANKAFRQQHHPTEPNGGSVFRNPEGGPPVGQMLDELGAKGVWHEGDAWVSAKHGNFIVNAGQATSTQVLKLMLRMKQAVAEHYSYTIYPENRVLGDLTAEEQALWAELKAGDPHAGA